MTNLNNWADTKSREVYLSTEASVFLKAIFETSDNVVLYDFFKDCQTIEEMNQAAIDIFEDELKIGVTYDDPEGTWEIIAVNEKTVDIKQVQEDNINFGYESEVPKEEALYYICK